MSLIDDIPGLSSIVYMLGSLAMRVKAPSDIAALIRARRTGKSLTQAELAARVGVSRAWIVQLEQGKATAQLGLTLRVLKELGVMLDAAPETALPPGAVDLNQLLGPLPVPGR